MFTLYILSKLLNQYHIGLYNTCTLLGNVRTLLELADEQWANVGWTGYDTVMTNSASAGSTKTRRLSLL